MSLEARWLDSVWNLFEELSPRDQTPVIEALELLVSFPKMFPMRRSGEFSGCRYFVAGKWIVYYQLTQEAIWIRGLWPARAKPL